MPLENLTVNRICLHEIYRRADDGGAVVPPSFATGLLNLPANAAGAFKSRVVAAFKGTAKCMEMLIRSSGPGSAFANGVALIAKSDADFVEHSRVFANDLASAQTSRGYPGGLVVVFDGTVGNPATSFFAVMKAELHDGFVKTADLQAQFLRDLFLSPKTKLYKIGIFITDGQQHDGDLPSGWAATVYDTGLSASSRDGAATYFYSSFLGLDIPENAAHNVKKFFEHTKEFIKTSNVSEQEKVNLYNSLYSYLKLDRGANIQTSEFADTYMDDELGEAYQAHMQRQHFPQGVVPKDLSEVSGSLRLRKLRFPRSITLSGPPDAVRDLVEVEAVEGDDRGQWTRITIRGPIEGQQ
ncbi:MAG: hypothetical protein DI565_12905 [Ancylobacter novellus]|uniref:Nucleoid-associated protein n=1 Tax=Ancylobacter novellus TaxID=921 RepID=A0A2W5MA58_ANCNO|nr:MAG: hypothetical protein DI565_12905 [Ancylobacter novellus]